LPFIITNNGKIDDIDMMSLFLTKLGNCDHILYGNNDIEKLQVDGFIEKAFNQNINDMFLTELNDYLKTRSFLVGNHITNADLSILMVI